MRPFLSLPVLALAAACTADGNLSDSIFGPPRTEAQRTADAQRRGAVEIAVKSTWPEILDQIAAGGGPALDAAFDAAGVPAQDRPTRRVQLRGNYALYAENPGALVTTLLLYGG
ncbi:MAG: hypothetical protein GC146_12225 [Limimaricola sp.]|nr:hypothetical protein [Limimaricola sp.]